MTDFDRIGLFTIGDTDAAGGSCGQIGGGPIRQKQKSRIVDHQGQPPSALLLTPYRVCSPTA